jgi:hypothetical protein
MSRSSEKFPSSKEPSVETNRPTQHAEEPENIRKNAESFIELPLEDKVELAEEARVEAIQTANSTESISDRQAEKDKDTPSFQTRRGTISKKQREDSFTRTIKNVQTELPAKNVAFSKIIHNKTVEKISNVTGNTIARPNAILFGSIVAFVMTLLTYTIAKIMGYKLSGFETIAAFFIGWLLGLLFDYFRTLFTGKH